LMKAPKATSGVTESRIDRGVAVRLSPGVVFREEDEGFLLYDTCHDILYEGNETGRDILFLCDGTRTAGEIADLLADASGSRKDEVQEMVSGFLAELSGSGLVGSGG
jgi:hypothetical protein